MPAVLSSEFRVLGSHNLTSSVWWHGSLTPQGCSSEKKMLSTTKNLGGISSTSKKITNAYLWNVF